MSRQVKRVAAALGPVLFAGGLALGLAQVASPPRHLIVIFVVDGLRPDSVNALDTPAIARLRAEGVEYVNSHALFPTVTRVNATALATGSYPVLNGIVGNSMFVASVNPSAPFDTADYRQLLKLEEVSGRASTAETLGEILQQHGRTLVTVSSGSTGNAFLLNPGARHGAGVAIHGQFNRGTTAAYPQPVSDAILQRFGPPADSNDFGLLTWTETVLRDYVLPDLRPDVVIDWLGPLDSAQHASGVGSPQAKTALRQIDASISQTIAKIDALGLRDRTDLIVTSDHGFAHDTHGVNVTDALIQAGLKANAESTDLVVASQGQSLLFYLEGHTAERRARLVRFLQEQLWVDLIFSDGGTDTRGGTPGTFSLDLINASHPTRGADVVASLAWGSDPNAYGVRGTHTTEEAMTGAIAGEAGGHGGLNRWVVRNTLIAWGADFRTRTMIQAPASVADIAPTVLAVLGLETTSAGDHGRGRILRELLREGPLPSSLKTTRRVLRTTAGRYRASVEISSVAGHDYVDGGSRQK